MTDSIRDSYDAMASLYAELFLSDLDHDKNSRDWLARFAERASALRGTVADLGCGPGHVTNHLSALGLTVVGYDLSPGQILQARAAFPDATFHEGDLTALDVADSSIGGIVSRHSLIHLSPDHLIGVFDEWMRVLQPGAPVFVSFFGSLTADTHGTPFDHKVVTAYELFPDTVANDMRSSGLTIIDVDALDPPKGGRPFTRATVLAQKPDS